MQKTLSVINLAAIRSNALLVKSKLNGKKFYAVVKADAYGHGAVQVAREIEDIVDGFCVAIVDEGDELRIGGITKPILVFAPPLDKSDVLKAGFYDLQLTVNSVETARLVGDNACHIKINTGMNRYGCNLSDLDEVLKNLKSNRIVGVYSHLYSAENEKESQKQLAAFKIAESKVKAKNCNAVAHIAASGGILRGGDYLCDGARCGIMLYGYAPNGFKFKNLQPSLKVYARLAQQTMPFGGGVGYNIADKSYKELYTYRAGYADGFLRGVSLGEKTLCMDAFISCSQPQEEGLIPIFIDADEYAKRCGTISYEVLCSVTRRSEKIYERRLEI
jgi:alanine racemase